MSRLEIEPRSSGQLANTVPFGSAVEFQSFVQFPNELYTTFCHFSVYVCVCVCMCVHVYVRVGICLHMLLCVSVLM